MTADDTSKKSETIEVRVSYGTKQALKHKCQSEGKTVSSVMRNFIHQYLQAGANSATRASTWRKLMFYAGQKPRRIIVVAVSLITLVAFGLMPIRAEDVSLQISGSVLKREGELVNTSNVKTTLVADYNERAMVRFEHQDGTVYSISLTAVPANNDTVMISSYITEIQGEHTKIIASPRLLVRFDNSARVEIGKQDADGRPLDIVYQLEILPTEL